MLVQSSMLNDFAKSVGCSQWLIRRAVVDFLKTLLSN